MCRLMGFPVSKIENQRLKILTFENLDSILFQTADKWSALILGSLRK